MTSNLCEGGPSVRGRGGQGWGECQEYPILSDLGPGKDFQGDQSILLHWALI